MSVTDLAERKKVARIDAGDRRQRAHAAALDMAGDALARHGLPPGVTGRIISGFLPFRSEIDTRPLLAKLHAADWITALPVVVAKGEPLVFRAWHQGEPLQKDNFGIATPLPTAMDVVPDVLLVPLLAFDRAGHRLGYGGGFYDRTLAKLRHQKPVTAIGVAYAAQEMLDLPRGEHDEPLDWIITEKGCRKCG